MIYLLFVFILLTTPLHAQTDSLPLTDHSDTVIIQQTRLPELGVGHHTQRLSREELQKYLSRNLSDVLALESSFFVKNYGPSNISTLSGRGGGASHTAVLWEGFNIQSPMLGLADISLLPSSFVDYIDIQYGGESALFGNSSVGGALHLGTQSKLDKGWQFEGNLHGGSFENFGQESKLSFSNHFYAGSIRSFYRSAQNNFPFKDINAFGNPKPTKLQTNAALEQFGILQENLFKINTQEFGLKFWYQNSSRQIPPNLLQTNSNDFQKDASFRTVLHWKMPFKRQVFVAKMAFFWEGLGFKTNSVDAWNEVLSYNVELEDKWYAHEQHQIHIGLIYNYFKAISTNYTNNPQQHRAALFLAYKISTKNQKWMSSLSFREEMVDGRFITPAVSLGSNWKFYKEWQLNFHLSHNYRLPTFNDLYWNILGNPNLKPEYSWNSELGINLPIKIKKSIITSNITGFCNLVNDWILWYPDAMGLWRPDNVEQVLARGLEANLKLKTRWKKWALQTGFNYAYTVSTRTQGSQTETIGKQLIYTPLHTVNAHLLLEYGKTSLLYQHSLNSQRFIDNANTLLLPLFHLGHLRLSQELGFKKMSLTLYFQINNIFGMDYQVVSNQAMPWQMFEGGLNLRIL